MMHHILVYIVRNNNVAVHGMKFESVVYFIYK